MLRLTRAQSAVKDSRKISTRHRRYSGNTARHRRPGAVYSARAALAASALQLSAHRSSATRDRAMAFVIQPLPCGRSCL